MNSVPIDPIMNVIIPTTQKGKINCVFGSFVSHQFRLPQRKLVGGQVWYYIKAFFGRYSNSFTENSVLREIGFWFLEYFRQN